MKSVTDDKIVAYKLTRPECSGWLFAGVTPSEVVETLMNELEMHDGLSSEECGQIVIEAYETTRQEIDNLPEHEGW